MRNTIVWFAVFVGIGTVLSTLADSGSEKSNKRDEANVIEMIQKLQSEAESDRAEISRQSNAIASLQLALKTAKEEASTATRKVETELTAKIQANRREVYADLSSTVNYATYPIAEMAGREHAREGHLHFDRARKEGYMAGLPNGHISAEAVGSIRWMPQRLLDKCTTVSKE